MKRALSAHTTRRYGGRNIMNTVYARPGRGSRRRDVTEPFGSNVTAAHLLVTALRIVLAVCHTVLSGVVKLNAHRVVGAAIDLAILEGAVPTLDRNVAALAVAC